MPQFKQLGDQPAGQAVDPRLNGVQAHLAQVLEADLHGRNAQVVQRAVFKAGFTARQHMHAPLHRGKVDGTTAKPGALQCAESFIAHQQAADPGRVAKHLVERHHHKIGRHGAQVQPVGGNIRGSVQQHMPPGGARRRHQRQRMLDAGKVGLRRKRHQVGVRAISLGQQGVHGRHVNTQFRARQRRVAHAGACPAGELADAVDRVVVVRAQQQSCARRKRIGLAHQFQGARRVQGEDRRVLAGGVEVVQHGSTRLLDPARHFGRAGVDRMRIAKHLFAEHLRVLAHLRRRVQAAAGEVQVDLPAGVEPAIFGVTQRIQRAGRCIGRVGVQEALKGCHGGDHVAVRSISRRKTARVSTFSTLKQRTLMPRSNAVIWL